jgi:hypothetical protein
MGVPLAMMGVTHCAIAHHVNGAHIMDIGRPPVLQISKSCVRGPFLCDKGPWLTGGAQQLLLAIGCACPSFWQAAAIAWSSAFDPHLTAKAGIFFFETVWY